MKKFSLLLFTVYCLLFTLGEALAYTSTDLSNADYLADQGIISKQSVTAKYRLDDTITRAEVVGIALKLKGATLPDDYFCKNYFSDVKYDAKNNWICRAMELAADEGIISKSNAKSRPQDTVSFTEAMAMISDAQCLIYKKEEFGNFYTVGVEEKIQEYDAFYSKFNSSLDGKIPAWELRLITGFHIFNGYEPEKKIAWLHRKMTRGEVFTLIIESRSTMAASMLGCKRQECSKKSYNSCTSDCLKVCPSSSCVGDTCPEKCSGGYCTDKRTCRDMTKQPDFIEWLPGHGIYEPLCKYDCTETNGLKRCEMATS